MDNNDKILHCIHIAFTIYGSGKDGKFWLNMATEFWKKDHGQEPISEEMWVRVASMLRERHTWLAEHPRFQEFLEDPAAFEFPE